MSNDPSPASHHQRPTINVAPESGRVTVRVGGVLVADSTDAVVLTEGRLPPRHYLPVADVKMDVFKPSDTSTH